MPTDCLLAISCNNKLHSSVQCASQVGARRGLTRKRFDCSRGHATNDPQGCLAVLPCLQACTLGIVCKFVALGLNWPLVEGGSNCCQQRPVKLISEEESPSESGSPSLGGVVSTQERAKKEGRT